MKEVKKNDRRYWKYVILFGLFQTSWAFIWGAYDNFFPVFLQAGNESFNVLNASTAVGFGLGAFMTGIIMTIDNFFGLMLTPIFGAMSDFARSRKKIVVTSGIIAAILVACLPLFLLPINDSNSGNLNTLILPLVLFVVTAFFMILFWSINQASEGGFKFTVIPSKIYNRLTSFIMFFGAIGYIVSAVFNSMLYKIDPKLPFFTAAGVLLITMILFAFFLEEPKETTLRNEEADDEFKKLSKNPFKAFAKGLEILNPRDRNNIIILYFVKVCGIFGIMGMQTYGSSYGINHLGINESQVPLLLAVFFVGYMLMTIPSGFIADRFGRRILLKIGLFVMAFFGVGLMISKNLYMIYVVFFITGFGNAIMDVITLAMVADAVNDKKLMGIAIGTTNALGKLSTVVSVPLFGFILEKSGNQFNYMFPIIAVVPLLGLLFLGKVPKRVGEFNGSEKEA